MIEFVADTHAIVWHVAEPRKLGRAARRALYAADEGRWRCHVPAISIVEIALLHERGRLRAGPAQVLDALSAHPGYSILPLDMQQAVEFASLPGVRDPMDRLIVAAARAAGSRLVSSDGSLEGHGVEIVWD
jgi:PIN domain nuclease of toxin-antitoxin system